MKDSGMWQADRTILSSRYSFPSDRRMISFPPVEKASKSRIADCSRMILSQFGLALGFDDASLWISNTDAHIGPICGTLVNYISYKTFIDYNILALSAEPQYPPKNSDINQVNFHLVEIVEKRKLEDGGIAVEGVK
jgi:hypothetical protein